MILQNKHVTSKALVLPLTKTNVAFTAFMNTVDELVTLLLGLTSTAAVAGGPINVWEDYIHVFTTLVNTP